MKIKLFAAAAAIGAMGLASAANAAVTVSATTANELNVFDTGVLLDDFDGFVAPHVSFVGNIVSTENPVVDAAAPPYSGPGAISICCQGSSNYDADPTKFESVEGGDSSTFSAATGYALTSFSFYMGSPDDYNHVTFNLVGGSTQTFNGTYIWGGGEFGGDRTAGFRVYYDFGGAKVSSITFSSDQNAFEADNFGGTVVAIPEPATWALMIMGFGAAGAMARSRRKALAA